MTFFKNLFNRKEKPQTETKPAEGGKPQQNEAPVQEQPAPAPVPAVDTSASTSIRKALDSVAQKLNEATSRDARQALKLSVSQALIDMRRAVDAAPCAYGKLDEVIIDAIKHLEVLCDTCTPEQMTENLTHLAEAIKARPLTTNTCDKFIPTMKTHYFTVLLISLQARLNELTASIAADSQFIASITSEADYDEDEAAEVEDAIRVNLRNDRSGLKYVKRQIYLAQTGLMGAKKQLQRSEPMAAITTAEALMDIDKDSSQYIDLILQADQERIAYANKRNAEAEQLKIKYIKHHQAVRERKRIRAERVNLEDMDAETTIKPAAPVQQAAPAPAELPPVVMPEMPDVFNTQFTEDGEMLPM